MDVMIFQPHPGSHVMEGGGRAVRSGRGGGGGGGGRRGVKILLVSVEYSYGG